MPTVTCSSCNHLLRIASDEPQVTLTCPRCLAEVANPARAGIVEQPSPTPPPLYPPGELERTCPQCEERIEPHWRYCPYCDASLQRRRRPRRYPANVEQDVGMDTSLIGGGLVVTGLLGGLGIIFFLCGGGLEGIGGRSGIEQVAVITAIIGVLLFGMVVAGMVVANVGRRRTATVAATVLGGIAIAILTGAMFISGIVFLFASCFAPCRSH